MKTTNTCGEKIGRTMWLNLAVTSVLIGACFLMPRLSLAQQVETVATCDEDGVPPIAEPVPMIYGDSTDGCEVAPATDSDSFRFDGSIGDHIRINVLGLAANFSPSIDVRDPVGTLIANGNADGASCIPPFNSICSFSIDRVLTMDGAYSIILTEQGANNPGSYTLQLERILPGRGIERLNYDSVAVVNGQTIEVIDDSSVSDSIGPQTDVDHYYFSAVEGTSIRINALGLSANFSPVIEVRDPTGAVVLNGIADGANCIPPFNSICAFASNLSPLMTGTYTLVFSERGLNNLGNYVFSLWCIDGDCDNDGDGMADIRPANLRYGEPESGIISPQVDGDFFQFMGTPGDEISFTVLGQSANFSPFMEVRDPTGAVVLNGDADGANCIPPFNSICSFTVPYTPEMMGTHTAVLYDRGLNNIGNYELTLTCEFSPGDFACENLPGRYTTDVPEDYWAFTFIETLADNGITSGCAADSYCPEDSITRAQMAVFMERGINGGNFQPPACTGVLFTDVTPNNFACDFIEQFFQDGITSGCAPNKYCPEDPVTRAQMAVFLLRGKYGAGYAPPAPTGNAFLDVGVNDFAAGWIEQLAAEGITSGCGDGNYCPTDPVTRAQMAVFLVRAFEL